MEIYFRRTENKIGGILVFGPGRHTENKELLYMYYKTDFNESKTLATTFETKSLLLKSEPLICSRKNLPNLDKSICCIKGFPFQKKDMSGIYQHKKGKFYYLFDRGVEIVSGTKLIAYFNLYNHEDAGKFGLWFRPENLFFDEAKGPDKTIKRFQLIAPEEYDLAVENRTNGKKLTEILKDFELEMESVGFHK